MKIKNNYLTKNLDNFLDMLVPFQKSYNQVISEIIHSSFLIAHDEEHQPVIMDIDNKKYAFIFTDHDEFRQTFPSKDVSAMKFELNILKSILKGFKLEAFILNVSSHNIYLTRKFLNNLNNLPSFRIDFEESYSPEDLLMLKESTDNGDLEEFLQNPGDIRQLIDMISSTALFGLVVSDKDMDILERDGVIHAFTVPDRYELYVHDRYYALFTSEEKIAKVKTSKFEYFSFVNFASIVHDCIKQEFKGIIINPGSDDYIIPTEKLLKAWNLINETCNDSKLGLADDIIFMLEEYRS